uniref:Class I hydrophobin Po.HYD n=1 Tax=Pleurotus ostreatus TaxID=5322 RepID=POHYD_PLEOS|nr:hydrophobin [Pleurotus ostreatus]
MFSKATLFFTTVSRYRDTQAPIPTGQTNQPTTNQCNTGPVQCCDTTQSASDPINIPGMGLVHVSNANGLVAFGNCSPLVSGGSKCNNQAVCCNGTEFNGLVNVGCTNVSL